MTLTPATYCCLALALLVVILCMIIVTLIERPRPGCRTCRGIDKRKGSGFCADCGDHWSL